MIPIIKWTMSQRKFSTLWWSVGTFCLIFVTLIFYPSFKSDAAQFEKSFDNLSDSAVQLLGGSTDFFSPVGYLNSQLFFITLPLLLGILAISLGAGLIAKEEQDKTIEGLLARPVSRSRLLAAKVGAGTLILSFVSIIGLITTLLSVKLVDLEVPLGNIALATLACFLLSLSFGAIAFVFTATGRARGASMGIATAIALGGYVISSLAGTVEWLKIPSKIFPFSYYHSEEILRGGYNWANVWFFVLVILAVAIISWAVFKKRDLA